MCRGRPTALLANRFHSEVDVEVRQDSCRLVSRIREAFGPRLHGLKESLALPSCWQQRTLKAMRERAWGPAKLKRCFVQYAKYVGQFTRWMGLIVANADADEVKAFLLPNLVDEVRDSTHKISHRRMLIRLLEAMGVTEEEIEQAPSRDETVAGCRYFEELYGSPRTLESLFAFGPGTEAVSWCFLEPMREVARAFGLNESQLLYFDVHAPYQEAAHVGAVDDAIYAELARQPEERWEEQFTLGCRTAEKAASVHQQFFDMEP